MLRGFGAGTPDFSESCYAQNVVPADCPGWGCQNDERVRDSIKVKAAGGIRDIDTTLEMIAAGAERIGTSRSVSIIQEYQIRLGIV